MTKSHARTPRDLLAAFHRAMVALSADDLAELHAPDAATVIETGERFLAPSLLVLEVRDSAITRTQDYSAGSRRLDERALASAR